MSAPVGAARVAAAWAVHTLTASGAVAAFLALDAIDQHQFADAFGWLAVAFAIDCVDGTLARAVDVKRVTPRFDGTTLDNIIDYLTYVVVPIALLHEAELLAGNPLLVAAAPLLASTYGFCRTDAKTPDHYFRGFPSYWNVLALYAWLLPLSPAATTAWVLILSLLVFVPIKFVYPSRTPHFRALTVGLGIPWAVLMLALMWMGHASPPVLIWGSLAYPLYYLGISLWLQARGLRA
jgi:phosphatidylcholine synthase